jgi:signal transduction histidine kinase
LLANRNLLAALAGPSIALTAYADGGQKPVRLSGEDLTRVLVNLVKNAAEAMPSGGTIQLGLRERPAAADGAEWLTLTVEDSGPGIPANAQEKIFESGYTSHRKGSSPNGCWAVSHRGLGLSITRSMVEGAGGWIRASNPAGAGARFELELPVSIR